MEFIALAISLVALAWAENVRRIASQMINDAVEMFEEIERKDRK